MTTRMTIVVLLVLTATTFILTGCSDTSTPAASEEGSSVAVATVNNVCPIMGGKVNPEVIFEWDGQTVGFCCAGCIPEFEKLDDKEKATKLAEAAAGKIENQMENHAPDSSPAT